MNYLKIELVYLSAPEWFTDFMCSKLNDLKFESFEETESGLSAFIPVNQFDEISFKNLMNELSDKIQIKWSQELIKDRNWNEEWEKNYFKPLVIKGQCVIRAPFHNEYPACTYEIVIEPNMAFGTGNHETTSMMIEFLLEENLTGKKILDMGCGTGILSIMASMLGAIEITAIDIDKWSFDATNSNAGLNNIKNIEAFQGDASLLANQKFDLILANIQRNVLLADMEKYLTVLKNGGKLVMSGFYKQDIPAIKEKAENLGLSDFGYLEKNNWIAYAFSK